MIPLVQHRLIGVPFSLFFHIYIYKLYKLICGGLRQIYIIYMWWLEGEIHIIYIWVKFIYIYIYLSIYI